MVRSVANSACTSSFWLVTETYSPVPMEKAPATSAATPVRITVCAETPPPPRPAISEVLVTSPSTAPNTVGRSQPPDTSRCRCDHPAASAACRIACPWSCLSSLTRGIIPQRVYGGQRASGAWRGLGAQRASGLSALRGSAGGALLLHGGGQQQQHHAGRLDDQDGPGQPGDRDLGQVDPAAGGPFACGCLAGSVFA